MQLFWLLLRGSEGCLHEPALLKEGRSCLTGVFIFKTAVTFPYVLIHVLFRVPRRITIFLRAEKHMRNA